MPARMAFLSLGGVPMPETYSKTVSSTIFDLINSDTVAMTRKQFEDHLEAAFEAGAAAREKILPAGDTTGRGGLEAFSRPATPPVSRGIVQKDAVREEGLGILGVSRSASP